MVLTEQCLWKEMKGEKPSNGNEKTWETRIKELVNGGKPVVPMTADIDALRPKSPFRPGNTGSGPGTNAGGGGASGGVVMGMQNPTMGPRMNVGGANRGFNPHGHGIGVMPTSGQNQMMGTPAGRMGGMNGMEMRNGMSMEGMMGAWPGFVGNMPMGMNVSGMGGMGGGMGMPMGGNVGANVMANGMGDMSGMGFHGHQQGGNVPMNGMPMFNPAMGALPWGEQAQFGMNGTWDEENAMNLNMNGLHGMNMGGSMGMGQWGQ
ncbi:hypothetical protein BT96DRAFT_281187 [Gymnopus androsaceus JB14]|uniref:Uncharacterized protein n=1 Tax=Gymnopus androsaceus JB14 TaxID=1447944 RepID=A0A6A4I9U5_9AGAR|nr:hypothetical protein BT96DRAFT_281187 [Gymnopus androsaceus JB14]